MMSPLSFFSQTFIFWHNHPIAGCACPFWPARCQSTCTSLLLSHWHSRSWWWSWPPRTSQTFDPPARSRGEGRARSWLVQGMECRGGLAVQITPAQGRSTWQKAYVNCQDATWNSHDHSKGHWASHGVPYEPSSTSGEVWKWSLVVSRVRQCATTLWCMSGIFEERIVAAYEAAAPGFLGARFCYIAPTFILAKKVAKALLNNCNFKYNFQNWWKMHQMHKKT